MNKETIPSSAVELGIDHETYMELAENISLVNLLTMEQREKILREANEKLPEDVFSEACKLAKDLAYERSAYKIAKLPYHEGPPKGQKIFTTAVFDYLLRKRPFESKT